MKLGFLIEPITLFSPPPPLSFTVQSSYNSFSFFQFIITLLLYQRGINFPKQEKASTKANRAIICTYVGLIDTFGKKSYQVRTTCLHIKKRNGICMTKLFIFSLPHSNNIPLLLCFYSKQKNILEKNVCLSIFVIIITTHRN